MITLTQAQHLPKDSTVHYEGKRECYPWQVVGIYKVADGIKLVLQRDRVKMTQIVMGSANEWHTEDNCGRERGT